MLILSVVTLIIAVVALILPLTNNDFRRALNISRAKSKLDNKEISSCYGNTQYHSFFASSEWEYSAFVYSRELHQKATHSLAVSSYTKCPIGEMTLMVCYTDYNKVSDDEYRLFLKDPICQSWTLPVKVEREFLEENLGRIVEIKAEAVSSYTIEGVYRINNSKITSVSINVLSIKETGIPVQMMDW